MYCCGLIHTIMDMFGTLCFPTFYMHTQGDAENMEI